MSDYRDNTAPGAFVSGEHEVLASDVFMPRTYRIDSAELASLAPSELLERIHSVARSRQLYVEAGGPKWAIRFCEDAKYAAERELAGRMKETT